jgi:hypothetical protein
MMEIVPSSLHMIFGVSTVAFRTITSIIIPQGVYSNSIVSANFVTYEGIIPALSQN